MRTPTVSAALVAMSSIPISLSICTSISFAGILHEFFDGARWKAHGISAQRVAGDVDTQESGAVADA